jgi:hypothetical protein
VTVIKDGSAANRSRYVPLVFQGGGEVSKRLSLVLDSSCQLIEPLETLDSFGVA